MWSNEEDEKEEVYSRSQGMEIIEFFFFRTV